ncbi:MAG: ABC transporter permease [Rhizobiales bacterium]|nr:ABC transporter permease [Hyphomicrobiales bacterium]
MQLMWQKFKRHKLAIVGSVILIFLYTTAIFANFLTPYSKSERFSKYAYTQPSAIHMIAEDGSLHRPFVYGVTSRRDPETLLKIYTEDTSVIYPIRFFVRGSKYDFLGFIPSDLHLFGVDSPAQIFIFGTDSIGRDLFTRTFHGAQLSLTIGLIGVSLSFLIGITLGGISGYFGGIVDTLIQRFIEILIAIPTIPLWIALSTALPRTWSVTQIYFSIVIILSLVGWVGLARVVRGKFLELRELDYVLAARVSGVSEFTIIRKHLLPNFASYLIVYVTLAIPGVILGETALSFLGLGLRSPAVSWGVLLEKSQNIQSVAIYWWSIIPAIFVILTVLAFNFVGDGLRDAADPYKK